MKWGQKKKSIRDVNTTKGELNSHTAHNGRVHLKTPGICGQNISRVSTDQ